MRILISRYGFIAKALLPGMLAVAVASVGGLALQTYLGQSEEALAADLPDSEQDSDGDGYDDFYNAHQDFLNQSPGAK